MEIFGYVLAAFFGGILGFFGGVKFVLRNPKMIAEFVKKHGDKN